MTNAIDLIDKLSINSNTLTKKKEQTDYKIKYVSEYVKQWAIINSERDSVKELSFIDCMCNAGIYTDGDLCTSIEVLRIFEEIAEKYPKKIYNLYLNDYDAKKIETIKKVAKHFHVKKNNIRIIINNDDVNVYLKKLYNNSQIFGYNKSVVLYVDPYDFGTVHISNVHRILEKYYCELIFNFFISDYVRNWKTDKDRISTCLDGVTVETKEDLIKYLESQFKVGFIKYKFSYQFKTQTNVELYQIMFFTPNKKGLEVLKDTLWSVFNGEFFHRNKRKNENEQFSLFTKEYNKEWLLELHAKDARNLLCANGESIMTYSQIEILLIEKSMLKESQIINNVIKPLINQGVITKMNTVSSKTNYKGDSYKIGVVK